MVMRAITRRRNVGVLQLAARCPYGRSGSSGSADGAVVADLRLTRKDVVSQDLQLNLMQ